MSEQNHTDTQTDNTSDSDEDGFNTRPWVFILIGGWIILILTAILHPYMNERVKFITEMGMGFTVVVAVIAQIEVSRRQWQVMRKAIHRQDADLLQWIDIEPLGIKTHSRSESLPPEEIAIYLQWKILNNTRLPLTLERVDISICRHKDWEVFEVVERQVIPPAGHEARNFYPLFVPLNLDRSQTKEFLEDGIGLSIAIRIAWADAIGERREQSFGDLYDCGIDHMEVCERLGKEPTFMGTEKGNEEARLITSNVNVLGEFTVKTQAQKRRNPN